MAAFVPTCEVCGIKGTSRCAHHTKNRPKATARGIVGNHRTSHGLACDGCGRHVTNIIQCYRLEGPAWTEVRSRRCPDSRCRDGWAPVSFERTGTTFKAMEIP